MRHSAILLFSLVLGTLRVGALDVVCTAGQLSTLVPDHNETSLTVTGTMDARDFLFISDHLVSLTTLNLKDATVVAYSSEKPLFGTLTYYPENEVPAMSLAGKLQLTTLSLPSHATSLGVGAVANCPLLSKLTLPSKLVNVGSYAFAWDTALTTVTVPWYTQTVGEGAFSHCTALKSVKVYANLHTLGNSAFLGCSALQTFTLSTGLQSIGERAFVGTAIPSFDFSEQTGLTTVGDWAFAGSAATSVVLPASVTYLGQGVFLNMTHLSSVTLPTSIKEIPDFLFTSDAAVSGITSLPAKVEAIGDYAFYNWSQVQTFTLPSPLYYIGERAMAGMTGLKTLTSTATKPPRLGDAVWDGVKQVAVRHTTPAESKLNYAMTPVWEDFKYDFARGDVNVDGAVDVGDLNAVINYMLGGSMMGVFVKSVADDNSDGVVDVADVNLLINNILGRYNAPQYDPNTSDGLSIDDFGVAPGQTITLELALNNSLPYTALQCDIKLPDGLELVDNTMEETSRMDDHEIAYLESDGNVRLLAFSMSGSELDGASGTPVVRFDVRVEHAVSAGARVDIDNVVFATADGSVFHGQPSAAQVSNSSGVSTPQGGSDKVYAVGGTLVIVTPEAATAQIVAVNGMSQTLAVGAGTTEHTGLAAGLYIVRLHGKSHKVIIR